ncbi:MBOAT family O-acyltransferase [Flavobacterium sp.]|uniref:MBOAT family O-acyltransferase n=1 Tax=Flavobacterium sp. TaxID=239 RepID=UPI0026271212|nr:MBOAT family O-acyltransferase [Flavobacterium sp.]
MLFNSLSYALFLPIVFWLYWFVTNKSLKWQNIMLLTASYFFYGCWDWRFVFLLAFSTLLDYYSGLVIGNATSQTKKKFWLILSVGINLGFLAVFKYYNFFISSFAELLGTFGFKAHFATLQVILPVGISFYTFHGLSYVFDIYNNRIKPTTNLVNYTLFVSFFPLLVAGPIERATHLLPQIEKTRAFNRTKAVDGLRQILWGLFKKIVIADNCATYANMIFNNSEDYSGGGLFLGALFFTFQIYGDFSGYSDIALGSARLMGFELLKNFNYPYFSRDMAEFWRRWHISLSSWFKDYVYIPLGGSAGGNWMRCRNTFIIFLVSGFWHGANWTFIIWGLLNALFIMPSILLRSNRSNMDIIAKGRIFPDPIDFAKMLLTFVLAVFAWIFFRAASVTEAVDFTMRIFDFGAASKAVDAPIYLYLLISFFMIIEWIGRENDFAIQKLGLKWTAAPRWLFYYSLLFLIYLFFGKDEQFIYFQF